MPIAMIDIEEDLFHNEPSPDINIFAIKLIDLQGLFSGISNGQLEEMTRNMTFFQLSCLLYQHHRNPEYYILRDYHVSRILDILVFRSAFISFGIDYLHDSVEIQEEHEKIIADQIDDECIDDTRDLFNYIPKTG